MRTPRLSALTVLSFLSLSAAACSSAGIVHNDDDEGQAVVAAEATCSADANKALDLAQKVATKFAASEKAWDDWRAQKAAADQAHQPAPPEPQVSYCDEVAPDAPDVAVSLADTELQTLKAVRGCSALASKIKTEPSLATLRAVLQKTLTLGIATGDVAADGRGLQAALDRGVEMHGPGMGAYGSIVRVTFGAGKAKVETVDIDSDGNMSDWKVKSEGVFSVEGKSVKIGNDTLELQIDEYGATLKAKEGADLPTFYDHPSECEA